MTEQNIPKRKGKSIMINKSGNNDKKVVDFLKEQIKKAHKEIEKIERELQQINKSR